MFPLKFRREVNYKETGVMMLSSHGDRMIIALIVLTQYQAVKDRRTNRQMIG